MHKELTLIIIRATTPDATILYNGLKGFCAPLLTWIDGHNIVVAIHQHGLCLGRDNLLGIYYGVAVGGHHLGTVGTRLDERCGQPLGTTHHIGLMLRLCADRRDTQQVEQLLQKTLLIGVNITFYFVHIFF